MTIILMVHVTSCCVDVCGQPEEHQGHPGDRVEFVHGNICDAELLDKLVPGDDAIVHYAGGVA